MTGRNIERRFDETFSHGALRLFSATWQVGGSSPQSWLADALMNARTSPYLAQWLSSECGVEAKQVRDLVLRDARDCEIFSPLGSGRGRADKDGDFYACSNGSALHHKSCGV